MRQTTLVLSVILLLVACNNDGPTSSSAPFTPAPTQAPVTERFTLSAPDGFFEFSVALATLAPGESFEIDFTPLAIRQGNTGFLNTVEFWVDQGPPTGGPPANGIAMGLASIQGNTWGVFTFTPVDGFVGVPVIVPIEVGGDFHTVAIRREQGQIEWLLDGLSVATIPKTRMTVYTRVVGTRTRFEYEVPADFLSRAPTGLGLGLGEFPCGFCQRRE